MTKQEVLNAMKCMNCFQDENMCNTNRFYRCRPSCKDCVGIDKANLIINDFVDLMVDRLEEANT